VCVGLGNQGIIGFVVSLKTLFLLNEIRVERCRLKKKGLNSIVILGTWSIWKHRNNCVFNGAVPNINTALSLARDDAHWWCLAGAKGLSLLTARGF
jgi:hypothetical protein